MKNPCVSISNLYLSIDIILFRSHIGATTAPNFFDVLNHFWSLFLIICWFNPHLWCLTSCGDETHTSGHIFPSQPVTGILSAVSLVTRLLFPIRQEPRGYKDFPNHMRFFVAIDLAKWYIYIYICIYIYIELVLEYWSPIQYLTCSLGNLSHTHMLYHWPSKSAWLWETTKSACP
jgi:hypothetical protein